MENYENNIATYSPTMLQLCMYTSTMLYSCKEEQF